MAKRPKTGNTTLSSTANDPLEESLQKSATEPEAEENAASKEPAAPTEPDPYQGKGGAYIMVDGKRQPVGNK